MSISQVNGAHYELAQKIVVAIALPALASAVIADDVDQANVSSVGQSSAVTLPAKPRPGQRVTVVAIGVDCTVSPNTGQTLPGAAAGTVSASFARDYVAVSTTVWSATALA